MTDRIDQAVRRERAVLLAAFPVLACLDQDSGHPGGFSATDIRLDVIADHGDFGRGQLQRPQRLFEEIAAGFADDSRLFSADEFQPGDEGADVDLEPFLALEILVLVHGDQFRAGIQLGEDRVDQRIAPGRADIADDHVIRPFVVDRKLRQRRQHAVPDHRVDAGSAQTSQVLHGGGDGTEYLAFADVEAQALKLIGDGGRRPGRGVGEEAPWHAGRRQPFDQLLGPGHGSFPDVQNAVQIDQETLDARQSRHRFALGARVKQNLGQDSSPDSHTPMHET